jgi:hypothetical protein
MVRINSCSPHSLFMLGSKSNLGTIGTIVFINFFSLEGLFSQSDILTNPIVGVMIGEFTSLSSLINISGTYTFNRRV